MPSDDTWHIVLVLLVKLLGVEVTVLCSNVCKLWRRELVAAGFCVKTVQLCVALAQGRGLETLQKKTLHRLIASSADERVLWLDTNAFLQRAWGGSPSWIAWASFHQWLQAASQEPDTSFVSKGAVSVALIMGLSLVQWVGKPARRFPFVSTLTGHAEDILSVAVSQDGTFIVSTSNDHSVKIWNAALGTEVIIIECVRLWRGNLLIVICLRVYAAGLVCGGCEGWVGGRCAASARSTLCPRPRSPQPGTSSSGPVENLSRSGTP